MVKRLARRLTWLLLVLHGAAWAAVTLQINPERAVSNQSVELTFSVTGDVDAEPDFSVLERAFEILNRTHQTTKIWLNGQSEESTTWVLTAMPRETGTIVIPAISFGRQSSTARELVIGDAPAPASGVTEDADIMLKVSVAPQSPYVQQQVVYTMKLLHRVDLANPRFSDLTASVDAVIKQLTTGRQFTEQINGRTYDGFEVKYVVFAQKSGKLRLAPMSLTTEVAIGRRSVFDPFAQSLSTRRVESQAIELEVKAVPASFPPGATWLPAKRLRLYEEWEPDVNSAEVGLPLTRTLSLWVDGLLAGTLPTLKQATPDGIKLYPDQAQFTEQDTANGYSTTLQQKFAIVASRAGEVQIEELTLPWWNVETDQLEIARLPARPLTVSAASAAAPPLAVPAPAPAPTTAVSAAPASGATALTAWRSIALLLGLAWLATLVLWWYHQRRMGASSRPRRSASDDALRAPHRARAIRHLKDACVAHDPRRARAALVEWAAVPSEQGTTLRSLREFGQRSDGALAAEIAALERHLYGANESSWQGHALWQAFQNQAQHKPPGEDVASALPGLFKLGTR